MLVFAANLATNCPDCPPVRAARAAVADDPELWLHVLGVLAPFCVIAVVAGGLYRLGAAPGKEHRSCAHIRPTVARSSPPEP